MRDSAAQTDQKAPNPRAARRVQRAEALRKRALSPMRILIMVLALPVSTVVIATGVYIRTSPYEPPEALAHLVALAGCDAAQAVGVAPAREGTPGYHRRNDPDGDGVACGSVYQQRLVLAKPVQTEALAQTDTSKERRVGSAKFIRP